MVHVSRIFKKVTMTIRDFLSGVFSDGSVKVSPYVKSYESHIGKELWKHTLGVLKKAYELYPSTVTRLCSLMHDVGKLNHNFWLKLHGKPIEGLYCNHSYLSFYALWNYMCVYKYEGAISSEEEMLTTAICILKHHSGLPNINEIINEEEFQRLKDFLGTNPYLPIPEFLNYVGFGKGVKFDLKNIRVEQVVRLFKTSEVRKRVSDPLSFFINLRMCFSSLVAGDKYDAGGHKDDPSCFERMRSVYAERVGAYLETLKKEMNLNQIRTMIRERCLARLEETMNRQPGRRVFCLTEPTGAGKTAILMALAGLIYSKTKVRKVIYSMSFLSIIEQVFDIIEGKIFKEEGDGDLIKRIDYKADPDFDSSSIDDCEDTFLKKMRSMLNKILKGRTIKGELEANMLLQDYLESTFNFPLIVTTFVQFFQAFTTANNKGLMRVSSLTNSIFLLDEIQAMPPRLYSFFIAILGRFCRLFNCYAVVSTATMPDFKLPDQTSKEMFKGYEVPVEIGDFDDFKNPIFNRYELHIIKEPVQIEGIAARISTEAEATLAVFNTVRDSRYVYDAVKNRVDCPVYLLNSNLHSCDRRRILEKCKDHLEAHHRFFLISTQLIEAGVDIDFPTVYRDVSPIPNIVQTSGRCNRNGKFAGRRNVYVFRLVDEEGHLRARRIYNGSNSFFLQYAVDTLFGPGSPSVVQEMDLFDIQKGFFTVLSETVEFGSWDGGNFVDQIKNFKFGDIGRFTVIPKDAYGGQYSFYVPRDGQDRDFEKLVELWADIEGFEANPSAEDKIRGILTRRRKLHLHVKTMMDRVVHVHIKDPKVISEYEGTVFDMYKLKSGIYRSEYGIVVEEG